MIDPPLSTTYITFLMPLLIVHLSALSTAASAPYPRHKVLFPFGYKQIVPLALYPTITGRRVCTLYKGHTSLRNTELAVWHTSLCFSAILFGYLLVLDLDMVEDKPN